MAEQDSTTKEKEFYGEVSQAQTILTGLAAIAFLMLRANETETDYTETFWEKFYEKCPWVGRSEIPTDGRLPEGLQNGLAELIFRESGKAWEFVDRADEIIRSERSVRQVDVAGRSPRPRPEGGE